MTIAELKEKYLRMSEQAYERAANAHPADAAMWRASGREFRQFVHDLEELPDHKRLLRAYADAVLASEGTTLTDWIDNEEDRKAVEKIIGAG